MWIIKLHTLQMSNACEIFRICIEIKTSSVKCNALFPRGKKNQRCAILCKFCILFAPCFKDFYESRISKRCCLTFVLCHAIINGELSLYNYHSSRSSSDLSLPYPTRYWAFILDFTAAYIARNTHLSTLWNSSNFDHFYFEFVIIFSHSD